MHNDSLHAPCAPQQNHLLATLPAEVRKRLYPHLELVPLPLGLTLCGPDCTLNHVYFPADAIVSLLYVTMNGGSTEIALVGNDGIVGVSLFMGGNSMPQQSVVQSAGHAYRLDGRLLMQEFEHVAAVTHLLLRYTQALLTQIGQTAVCNRYHSVEHGTATLPLAPVKPRSLAIE